MNKARFDVENSGFFEVQYNPENFKVDRSASWKESEDQGTLSGLEFQKACTSNHFHGADF